MDVSMIPGLLQRLEKLERSNRRLKLSGLVVLFGLLAFGVMGQARPPLQTVEAQEFVVKDAGGNVLFNSNGPAGEVSGTRITALP